MGRAHGEESEHGGDGPRQHERQRPHLKIDAARSVDHNRNPSVTHLISQAIRFLLSILM
jgi:Ser-tRNA(Ala) deacylase AlaX